jgi:tripartite-type tricarboxylate transporter receptor subunit TctC
MESHRHRRNCIPLALALAWALAAPSAFAQSYPTKPVRVIVPFPTGEGAEQSARIMIGHLTEHFGQSFFIDTRPGGNTIIGAVTAARSAPDGYTLLLCAASTMAANPILFAGKLPYDPDRDFEPIGGVVRLPFFLVVSASVPASSFRELVALARSRPRELSYASNGTGTTGHLVMEQLRGLAGLQILHVPYTAYVAALPDLLSGRVTMMMADLAVAGPSVRMHKLRALASASIERSAFLPDVPTVAESGVPRIVASEWFGLFAPAGTPREIIALLGGTLRTFLSSDEARVSYASIGLLPFPAAADTLRELLLSDRAKFAKIIRDANIRVEGGGG